MRAGKTALERQQAEQLLPIIKRHHLLLVTLLLLNTVAGEALPIFLQSLMSNSLAVAASVILVLVFGEILPTALFTGPNQLAIASRLVPLVKVLIFVMYPVTYPIARLLDKIMHGDDENDYDNGENESHTSGVTLYNRGELAALIRVQYEERLIAKQRRKHRRVSSLAGVPDLEFATDASSDIRALTAGLLHHHVVPPEPNRGHRIMSSDSIDADEVTMMEGALQMKTRRAVDIFVSFHKVFCISADMILDETNIFSIYASGYSRVPVFIDGDKRRVKGILMTRQLIVVNQKLARNTETTTTEHDAYQCHPPLVSDLSLHIPQCVSPDTNLIELVNIFQTGGSAVRAGHMALICARPDIANTALEGGEAVPEDAGLMGCVIL
jgi:metal transporter CNNM